MNLQKRSKAVMKIGIFSQAAGNEISHRPEAPQTDNSKAYEKYP